MIQAVNTSYKSLDNTDNQKNDPDYNYKLGIKFLNGDTVGQSDKEAVNFFRIAAKKGHFQAQNQLGYMYEKGRGVKKSFVKAERNYQLSALNGYSNANTSLGLLYLYNGLFSDAISYLQKGVAHKDGLAAFIIGNMYVRSLIPSTDVKEDALKYWNLANDFGFNKNLNIYQDLSSIDSMF